MNKISRSAPILAITAALTAGCVTKQPHAQVQVESVIVEVARVSGDTRDDVRCCVEEGDGISKKMLKSLRAVIEKYENMHYSELFKNFEFDFQLYHALSSELRTIANGFPSENLVGYHRAELRGIIISNKPEALVDIHWVKALFDLKETEAARDRF